MDAQLELAHRALDRELSRPLARLFTPQHGLFGEQQDNMKETAHSTCDGRPLHSLYSETRRPTAEMLDGLDVLVVDLQDVGCRVYTYVWTLSLCMEACAEQGIAVVVLDRPNPVGGREVEGPRLAPDAVSFVGRVPCPLRHAATLGELAGWLRHRLELDLELEVVPMAGWARAMRWDDLGRRWIPPSPNLPRTEGVDVYPGQVLLEGTNLSEGRGTTTPFEICGAPFLDGERWWTEARHSTDLPGVHGRPIRFTPMFGKWQGRSCGGVALHVHDAEAFRPVRTTLALIRAAHALHPDEVQWSEPPYEYEFERAPIDLLYGSDRLRAALCEPRSADPAGLAAVDAEAWWEEIGEFLLYPRRESRAAP